MEIFWLQAIYMLHKEASQITKPSMSAAYFISTKIPLAMPVLVIPVAPMCVYVFSNFIRQCVCVCVQQFHTPMCVCWGISSLQTQIFNVLASSMHSKYPHQLKKAVSWTADCSCIYAMLRFALLAQQGTGTPQGGKTIARPDMCQTYLKKKFQKFSKRQQKGPLFA